MRKPQVQLRDQGPDLIGNTYPVTEYSPEAITAVFDTMISPDANLKLQPGTVYEIFVKDPEPVVDMKPEFVAMYIVWQWTPDTDQDAPLGDVVEEFNEEGLKVVHRARTPE